MKRSTKVLVSLPVLGAAVIAAAVVVVELEGRHYSEIAPALKSDLGFDHGSPYRDGREVFIIAVVEPGKPMAAAGALAGDRVLGSRYRSIPRFYFDLEKNRGASFTFEVEREGSVRTITVSVPAHHTEGHSP